MAFIIEDSELLQQFRNKATQERAFAEIVKKYQEKLYWHIRRMVVNHDDAHDVMQQTFIKIWKGLPNFREDSQLYTWIYRIATNECLSFLDKQKRKPQIKSTDEGIDLTENIKASEGFDANKLEWKLQLAIQSLPEKQRLVFTMRYYDELSYEDMSQVLETSPGALKASYHHAAKKIEEYILNH